MVQLMNSIDRQILIAHRMPPERLGISAEGFFGSHTPEQNQIYRTSVIDSEQISEELNQIWEDQLSKNPLSNIIMAIGSQAQVIIEPLSPPPQ